MANHTQNIAAIKNMYGLTCNKHKLYNKYKMPLYNKYKMPLFNDTFAFDISHIYA